MNSVCGARQSKLDSLPTRVGFLTGPLTESSSQGPSIYLQIVLSPHLNRIYKMELNVANVTKANNILMKK